MYLRKHTRAGFTLVELLVVIAIISVLSGIVLVNVNQARNKGKNARAVADVSQYMTGLALVREREGSYPSSGWVCLGGSGCRWASSNVGTNSTLNNSLSDVMPSLPTSSFEVAGYRGYQYSGTASSYSIRWFLYGEDRNCEMGTRTGNASGISLCMYTR